MLAIISVFCFCLAACDPSSYRFDRDQLLNNTTGIELINYDNPKQKQFNSWVPNHYSKLRPLKLENITILETMEDDTFNDIINQLSDIYFLYRYYAFDSPNGICIRMLYSNGDFDLISCDYQNNSFHGYVGRYDNNGKVVDFFGTFENGSESQS